MAEQQYLDLKHLDKQLDEFEKKKKKIKKMRIGYKLFAHLIDLLRKSLLQVHPVYQCSD